MKLILWIASLSLLGACAHIPPLTKYHDPLSAEEHARLGASYETQGLREEAVGQYRSVLRQDPSNVPAEMALGNMAFEDGDLKGAERYYQRVLKVSPSHAGAGNNLAMVFLAQNRKLAQAEQLAQEALRQNGPLKPYILDTLANIYVRQNRYAEARAALDQAEAAAPPDDRSFQGRLHKTKELVLSMKEFHK